jgi:hypothetical protein
VMSNYPKGHRYVADSMFTSASADELLSGIRKIIETMPPHPSHFILTGWKPSADRADMAYGLEDEIYLALYTVWQDPADDERCRDWGASNMAAMSRLSTGIALADENLGRRRRGLSATRTWRAWIRSAQSTTRTVDSTAGCEACRPQPIRTPTERWRARFCGVRLPGVD